MTEISMGFLQKINDGFTHFLDQGDPRVKSWPMMQTPFPGFVLIVAYIYFVKVAGPKWMKRRKAFDLRNTMLLYNFVMIFVNLYIFLEIGRYGWFNNYSLRCEPVDYSDNYEAVRMARAGWLYYVTKFAEFADTIFFVLRKKNSHVSPLHVIHHSIVPFSVWFGIKFAPGGYNALFPFLNSFVHVLMYSYYGLAALGPQIQKYLIWKKYLTYIQMGQFLCIVLYTIHLVCFGNCEISSAFIGANAFHAVLFLILFWDFCRKAYTTRSKGKLCIKRKTEAISSDNVLNGDKDMSEIKEVTRDSGPNSEEHFSHSASLLKQHKSDSQKTINVLKSEPFEPRNGHVLRFKMKISTDFFSPYSKQNTRENISSNEISKCTIRSRNGYVAAEPVETR